MFLYQLCAKQGIVVAAVWHSCISSTGEYPQDLERQDFVLMRPVIADDCRVVLFGAGHVGRALVGVLEPVADRIFGADGRQDVFIAFSVAAELLPVQGRLAAQLAAASGCNPPSARARQRALDLYRSRWQVGRRVRRILKSQ